MRQFSEKDRAEYFHRSYKAVDGLWFVKTEEKYSFDTAIELDRIVWEVMPKIQARFLKKKLGVDKGIDALVKCFSKKLELDGFEFKIEKTVSEKKCTCQIDFVLSRCPWHDILIKSGREHLSEKIGGIICGTEYKVWASEFGPDLRFIFGETRICRGHPRCVLSFRNSSAIKK